MAILALANDLKDLRKRFSRIIVATSKDGKPVTAEDVKAAGAMTVVMKDALKPNLVQTVENVPCIMHAGPFANIVKTGLDHADDEWLITRDVLQEAGRQEAEKLTRHLGAIETVAAVAPLLGLLGTVTGMIRVFSTISVMGLGDPEHLSTGISEAMFTTAFGLGIGIPALVGHNWLQGRADAIIFELEGYASKVLDTLRGRRRHRQADGVGIQHS